MNMRFGMICETGDKRTSKLDNVLCLLGMVGGQGAGLFIVADGMGGLSYGAEISRLIVMEFRRWWEVDLPAMEEAGCLAPADVDELLEQEIWDIHQEARRFGKSMRRKSGSTLSLLLILKGKYYIKNLGDSRIYRFRRGTLERMTADQSLEAQMIREGKICREDEGNTRYRHMLTMCVGVPEIPVAVSAEGDVRGEDCFLLCSDGLYNCLKERQLEEVLADSGLEPQDAAGCLRKMIRPGTASDNLSAVVVRIQ